MRSGSCSVSILITSQRSVSDDRADKSNDNSIATIYKKSRNLISHDNKQVSNFGDMANKDLEEQIYSFFLSLHSS